MTNDSRTGPSRRITAGCLALTAARINQHNNGKVVRVERRAPPDAFWLDGMHYREGGTGYWVVRSLGTAFRPDPGCDSDDAAPSMFDVFHRNALIPLGDDPTQEQTSVTLVCVQPASETRAAA